jgi:hypothetical protein
MMKLAKSATGRPWQNVCPPFWWQKKSKERKKCIYETGFHSDLLIHEKLRSEIIVKADFKSAIIIEKKKLLLINWKRK